MPGRRLFIHQVAATACLVVARNAFAESPMLSPSEPAAQALGYTADATRTMPRVIVAALVRYLSPALVKTAEPVRCSLTGWLQPMAGATLSR